MDRLEQILQAHPGQRAEFTLERLSDLVHPRNREELVLALGQLVRKGRLKKLIRVVSPRTQGGIGDYASLDDVPRFTTDWRSGMQIEITPEDLRFIYVVPAENVAGRV